MKNISFYNLMSQWIIEVPIFQRDYAQGRDNSKAEDVRKTIVSAMIDAVTKNNSELFFDFVYGRHDNGIFIPFDGQQRLTTLYLFHCYILKKCKDEKCCSHAESCPCTQLLGRFSYETRQSSREFCEKLVEKNCIPTKGVLSDYIKQQPWFYSDWEKDPTIDGMLRLLDEIHNQIKERANINYKSIAERLTSGCCCPIKFHLVDMGKYKLPDATYVKMNARGKTLTAFENFKASLEEYLEKSKEDEIEDDQSKRTTLLDDWKDKIDGTWLDFFWNKANEGKNDNEKTVPDSLMMSFTNRYLMNVWRNYYAKLEPKDKDAEDFNESIIDNLLFYPTDDTFISFTEVYEPIFARCGIEVCLKLLINFWTELVDNKHLEITDNCCSVWERGKSEGWNLFNGNINKNNRETYPSRVVYYAIILYFTERVGYNEDSFKQWMRVVWNIIENQTPDSPETYDSALKLINELSEYSHDIYNHLQERTIADTDFASEQMKEEKEKAELILNENIGNQWLSLIIKAESQQFFRGRITSLLEAGDKNYENVVEILELCVNNITKSNKDCLKKILTYIDSNHSPLCCKIDNELHIGWKQNIIYGKAKSAVIEFFRNRFNEQEDNSSWSDWKKRLIEHYDELNPHEGNRTIRKYNGWWSDYIFLYEYGDVRYARLLSGNRPELIAYLHNKGVIEINNIFEGSNDCGNLWVEIKNDWLKENQITIESRLIRLLFGHKDELVVRLLENKEWRAISEKDFIKTTENDKSIECQIYNILKSYKEA
jgi:hypothetical protein